MSEAIRARNVAILNAAALYRAMHGRFTLSAVTVFEIVKGYRRARLDRHLLTFLAMVRNDEVLPLDTSTAVLAGRIHGDLTRTGQTIGPSDPMIAATAIEHGLTLVTGNTAHFARIAALGYPLTLVDWRNP